QTSVPDQTSTLEGPRVRPPYVRFGSKADICSAKGHVRFTPNSDIDCVFRHVRFGPKADSCSAAKKKHYSITSSTRVSSDDGTVRSSALAVFRLITSSNLVAACTGKSAGFSPLRMRST